jgi:hypothetical protein
MTLPNMNDIKMISKVFKYPLLEKAVVQHVVGGEIRRGGLLVLGDCCGGNKLGGMALNGRFNAIKAFLNAKPPFPIQSDVSKYSLIHAGTIGKKLDMMKMMIEIDPKALYIVEIHKKHLQFNLIQNIVPLEDYL